MIRLHPIPEANYNCPACDQLLEVKGWYMPGMRCLAELRCKSCGRGYYGDLASGHAVHSGSLLDRESGECCGGMGNRWYADSFLQSYRSRISKSLGFEEEIIRLIKRPLLLNCMDSYYGHSLLKLLNAQKHLDHDSGCDLIVIVPKWLRWMVPDGCAAVWTIDMTLREGVQWNDWLAEQIHTRLQGYAEVWLSPAHSHPSPSSFNIARFTRVEPFPWEKWDTSLSCPIVTFLWRSDRLWYHLETHRLPWFLEKIRRRLPKCSQAVRLRRQDKTIISLAERLRIELPSLQFAIMGIGEPGGFPSWIQDLRTNIVDSEKERQWCLQYARSHCVVGVHGSGMLLASAHARLTVDLMPVDRWGNVVQDILVQVASAREALLRYHCVPISISAGMLQHIVMQLIRTHAWQMVNMADEREQSYEGKHGNVHCRR